VITGFDVAEVTRSDESLRRFLDSLPSVDKVGLEARAATLASRSIKTTSKQAFIDLAIRMIDLTTLEGMDTPEKIHTLCAKAIHPDPFDLAVPSVAAVCVYPDLVSLAKTHLRNSPVQVASVATAFPSGRSSTAIKLSDTKLAVDQGADEIDMVIDRGAFLAGHYFAILEEIVEIKEACGKAHLKVILETGELQTYDNIKKASWIAMLAGADFIKTSTGKVNPAATLPVVLEMLYAVRDWYRITGNVIGMKPAGGIRSSKDALRLLVLVNETLGTDWLDPNRFRIGASTLLNDLLMQRHKLLNGNYSSSRYVTID
jgi:deoxyribose-phosphate aldolase